MIPVADASTLAADVRSGRRTARDVVDEALERIAGHRTNAVVTVVGAEARAAAQRVDAAIARGADAGPLAGVPFTVKDTIATAGTRATAGSLVLTDHVSSTDATVVRRLRAAGAILVGKTNCPEFALQARTENRLFGATVHPFDESCSPGGSSGGCAAAVAGGLVAFSVGGDYGGSIRYPASCVGIYGLRPTHLRPTHLRPADLGVPTAGQVPEPAPGSARHRFQTIGPLARTARDIGLVFGVLAERAVTGVGSPSPGNRVGVVRGGWTTTAGVVAAVDATASLLADRGFDVVEVDAGPFIEASAVFDAWRAGDDYADLRALVAGREDALTAHIARLLAATPTTPPADLPGRFDAVRAAVDAILADTPNLVLPVARVGVLGVDATTVTIGEQTESVDALQVLAPSRAVSLLGLPALAVPAAIDDAGLPIGVQLVGRAGSEGGLVTLATRIASSPALGDAPVGAVDDDF